MDASGAKDEGAILRTAKSCGPDAPTLASSWWRKFHRRWWQTSPVTRESAEEAVKTIARGMPDVSGVTVVTNACAFYQCARGCGRAERPAFPAPLSLGVAPRPLFSEGRTLEQNSGASRGEIAESCRQEMLLSEFESDPT